MRVAFLRRAPELLDGMGADTDALLSAVGLARADFVDAGNLIPYAQVERLLVECEQRTACEHFGLLLCEQTRLEDMGLPGRVARCGSTVGEALQALVRTYNFRRGGGIVNLIDDDSLVHFVFAMATLGTQDTRHYQMGAITITYNLLEELCGPGWQPEEVRFAFRSPANLRPFQRFFRAPLRFDADESAVIFDRDWLTRTLPPVDASFRLAVAAEVDAARKRAFQDFPELVRDIVRRQISSGPCSIESVSATLSMHRRTLDRRLARRGERYGALQKAVKYEIARQLLRETDLSVQQIADFLHFSSAANFATAFRRWSGTTPSGFRSTSD